MDSDRRVDIFLFEDSFLFTSRVFIKKVEDDKIVLSSTPLLGKFVILGKRVYIKFSTFALPTRVLGKSENEVIVSLPSLNPEKPVGDRKSARVYPSKYHPVRVFLATDEGEEEYEVVDISEGGFSIRVNSTDKVEALLNREVDVRIDFPVEGEEVFGKAVVVNVQETEEGNIKLGFELLIDDADSVKVRFYVYSRIREILKKGH